MRYLFCLLVLVSCFSPKRAERQLAKIAAKYPAKLDMLCADSFKVVEKRDTVISTEYDWIELEPEKEIQISNDTIVKIITKYKTEFKTITITNNIENVARVKELSDKLNKCSAGYQKADAQAKKFKGYTKILSLLLALLIFTLYFVLKRKK